MKQDLTANVQKVEFGNDSVVIVAHYSDIPGGRTLDVGTYPLKSILAGHVIIKSSDGVYKPMPIVKKGTPQSDGIQEYEYGTLPESHTYAGVLYRSILTSQPAASIMDAGKVNIALVPYDMKSIKDAFEAAVKGIQFTSDEEA